MRRVIWSELEWDQLAGAVFRQRIANPRLNFLKHVEEGQQQLVCDGDWDHDRVRRFNTASLLDPLVHRLREFDKQALENDREVQELRERLTHVPTEDEFLETLPDEVIRKRFTTKVLEVLTPQEVVENFLSDEILGSVPLAHLCGYAVRRFVEDLQLRQVKVVHQVQHTNVDGRPINGRAKPRLPRVALVGFKESQFHRVTDHFAGQLVCLFINKMRLERDLPNNLDGIVVWSNFASRVQKQLIKDHCRRINLTADRRVEVFGGFNSVMERLELFCN